MAKAETSRFRNYATIVYPESAPEDWQDILSDNHVPAFISPLHDSDHNPTGEIKKEHYHVMIMFEGVKTRDQAKKIFDQIGGVGCDKVESLRGYARYLCHLDNPEKAQYDTALVRSLSGADYIGAIGLAIDKYKAIREMIVFCQEKDILRYSDLLEYCMVERSDWFRVLCDNGTYVIKEYLKSKTWSNK